jgi:hypothetical protein
MHTSILHIRTFYLPAIFLGFAFASLTSGIIFNKETLKRFSYLLYLLTFLITTLTCAFGGASMRAAERSQGVLISHLKTHAWTSMIIFLISVILAWIAFRMYKGAYSGRKQEVMLLVLSLFYIIIYITTSYIAFGIR